MAKSVRLAGQREIVKQLQAGWFLAEAVFTPRKAPSWSVFPPQTTRSWLLVSPDRREEQLVRDDALTCTVAFHWDDGPEGAVRGWAGRDWRVGKVALEGAATPERVELPGGSHWLVRTFLPRADVS